MTIKKMQYTSLNTTNTKFLFNLFKTLWLSIEQLAMFRIILFPYFDKKRQCNWNLKEIKGRGRMISPSTKTEEQNNKDRLQLPQ